MSDDEEEIESMDTGDTSLTSPGSDNTTLHAPNTPATPATPSAPPTTDLEKASSVNSRDEAEDEDEVLEGENKDDDRRVSRDAILFLRLLLILFRPKVLARWGKCRQSTVVT